MNLQVPRGASSSVFVVVSSLQLAQLASILLPDIKKYQSAAAFVYVQITHQVRCVYHRHVPSDFCFPSQASCCDMLK